MTKERVAYRVALGAPFLGCLLVTTAIANAQSVVSGVSVVAPPPAGFNVLRGSPEARAQYAVPPAPDAAVAPEAYRRWERALSSPQKRTTPVLEHTDIYNGPAEIVGPTVAEEFEEGGIANTTSSNWSGSAVVDSSNPFKTEAIIGEFVVPTAHQAFGSCTGGWDYSFIWPGIDGYGSSDVLQAGVEVDALCSGGKTSGFYSAWVEWFPNSSTRVSSPAIHPGDLIFVEVWNTSPTKGYAYFYNYSTEESAEYVLTAPGTTTLVGNSVDWVVERPSVGGRLATLTNYIDVSWPYGVAWNYKATKQTYYYMGSNPPTGTLYEIKMLDDGGKGISFGSVENSDFLYFQDYGSACGRSGAPPC